MISFGAHSPERFLRALKFGILANGRGAYEDVTITRNRIELVTREPVAVLKLDSAPSRRLRIRGERIFRKPICGRRGSGGAGQGEILPIDSLEGRGLPRGSRLRLQGTRTAR